MRISSLTIALTLVFSACEKEALTPENLKTKRISDTTSENSNSCYNCRFAPETPQRTTIPPCVTLNKVSDGLELTVGERLLVINRGNTKLNLCMADSASTACTILDVVLEKGEKRILTESDLGGTNYRKNFNITNPNCVEQGEIEIVKIEARFLNESEINDAVNEALTNINVSAYKTKLEHRGYEWVPEHSIGFKRFSDGAFIVTLSFKRGKHNGENPKRTTTISYRKRGTNVEVLFFDAIIMPDVSLRVLKQFEIVNGGMEGTEKPDWEGFGRCLFDKCGFSILVCGFSDANFWSCILFSCGFSALRCAWGFLL